MKLFDSIGFDLDGTLWDFTPNAVIAWARALAQESDRSAPPTLEMIRRCAGLPSDVYAPILLPQFKDDPERLARVCARCVEEGYSVIDELGGLLYPGVEEMLAALQKEHALYIASNCDPPYIEKFLHAFGLEKYFTDWISYGETKRPKGENIRILMERSGLSDTLFVGDMPVDYEASQVAGVPFVHAAYGFGPVAQARRSIRSPGELPALVSLMERERV